MDESLGGQKKCRGRSTKTGVNVVDEEAARRVQENLDFRVFHRFSLCRLGELSRTLRLSPLALLQKRTPPLTSVKAFCYNPAPRGQLVWDCGAVEKGTRPSAAPIIRIECGTCGFCGGLQKWLQNQASPQIVSTRARPDFSRSESTLGKSERATEGCFNCYAQTNDVGLGSSQDRSVSTSKMGKGQAGEESRVK